MLLGNSQLAKETKQVSLIKIRKILKVANHAFNFLQALRPPSLAVLPTQITVWTQFRISHFYWYFKYLQK